MRPLNYLSVVVALVCVPVLAQACDICGCSGSGASMGLLPLVQRHFVGLRWQSQAFDTDAHGSEPNSLETFRTLDLWGRWQLHRRVQLLGTLPYNVTNRRFDNGVQHQTRGLGDASLLAQFALLDPARQATRNWQHALQFGAGAKLPTGQHRLADAEGNLLNPQIQPGSGSTDLLFSALYALRHRAWGLSLDGTLRLNGKNDLDWQAGNRLSSNLRAFWVRTTRATTWAPYAGLALEMRDADRDQGIWQTETGGYQMAGAFGAEVFRGRLAFSAGGQVPVLHHLSEGRVTPKARWQAGVTLLFGGKRAAATPFNAPMIFQPAPHSPADGKHSAN